MAVAGLVVVVGAIGLVPAALFALTSPPAAAAASAVRARNVPTPRWRDLPVPGADPNRQTPTSWAPSYVSELPDDLLCRAWQVSYLTFHQRPPADHLAIVMFRAAVLDELQNRHPRSYARWMDEGARAASNPARYLKAAPSPADGSAQSREGSDSPSSNPRPDDET